MVCLSSRNALVECEYVWLLWYWEGVGGCDLGFVCRRKLYMMEVVLSVFGWM